MIRDIVTVSEGNEAVLTQKSDKIVKGDPVQDIIRDLLDTAQALTEVCVGLAAVQIGIHKRVCVVKDTDGKWFPLVNPVITERSSATVTSTEGCLSLEGTKDVKRHTQITIMSAESGKIKKRTFYGTRAIVVQHEIDHMNGILI